MLKQQKAIEFRAGMMPSSRIKIEGYIQLKGNACTQARRAVCLHTV